MPPAQRADVIDEMRRRLRDLHAEPERAVDGLGGGREQTARWMIADAAAVAELKT